jgi:hypothetical protein
MLYASMPFTRQDYLTEIRKQSLFKSPIFSVRLNKTNSGMEVERRALWAYLKVGDRCEREARPSVRPGNEPIL